MNEPDFQVVKLEDAPEPDRFEEALERMEPLEAAAHRTAKVIGCLGVLGGLGGGVLGGFYAGMTYGAHAVGWGILAGSALPFAATALLEVNNWLAIRRARRERLSVGTRAAIPAITAADDDDPPPL